MKASRESHITDKNVSEIISACVLLSLFSGCVCMCVCGRWFLPAMLWNSWPCNYPQVTAQPFNLYINNSSWTSRSYVFVAFTHHFSVHTRAIINLPVSFSLPYGWVKTVLIGPHFVSGERVGRPECVIRRSAVRLTVTLRNILTTAFRTRFVGEGGRLGKW